MQQKVQAVGDIGVRCAGIVDNGDGTYTVDWGTELTFVAQPAEGFMLESWSNGAEVTGDTLKLTMTEELSLTANFKYIPAVITLPDGVSIVEPVPAGITDNGDGTYTVEHGTEFQVSVDSIPAHYHFDHWADLDAEDEQYAANPRTIVADSALTLEPIFAIDTHTLTLATNDSTKGVVILEGAGQGGEPEGEPVSVTIGDPTSAEAKSEIPCYSIMKYTYSQQIYTAKEIGGAGEITAITYWLKNSSEYTRTCEIYMKEVSESAFASNTSWVLLAESDKVASYELTNGIDAPVAQTITLNTPFEYSGKGNLLIAFNDVTGQESSGVAGLVNDVTGTKALFSFRDNTAYDVTNPSSNGILDTKRNVVKIDMIAAPSTLPEGIVDNGDGTYTVDWGTELTFVAQPAEDYHLVSWNGEPALSDTLTVTVTDELSVSAFFKHDTYILTVEGTEIETAKFFDGTDTVVILNPGTLVGVQTGDNVQLTTTATFSSAAVGDNLTITVHYAIEVIDGGIYDNEYALAITDSIYPIKGFIIEPLTPDAEAEAEEEEAENKEGLEIQAYGYCNGSSYSIKYHLKSGNPDQYKIDFADARFTDVDWTDLTTNGSDGTIDVEIPVDLPTGDYSMTVTFRDSRFTWLESEPIEVSLHVNLPETYVVALFDDVMAVVDTCECLTDIQWYWRANSTDQWQAIEGATGYYYKQAGGLSGEYFIKAKMNGIDTYTCPQEDLSLYADGKRAKVTAYPNPVQSTTTVTIENSLRYEHDMRIVNLMGSEVLNTTFEGNTTTVEMDAFPHGSYIISVDGVVVNVMKQ